VTLLAVPVPRRSSDAEGAAARRLGRRDRRGLRVRRARLAFANSRGAPVGAYTSSPTPTASSPRRRCTRRSSRPTSRRPGPKLAPGYIFTANFYDLNYPPMVGQSGPLILDDNLQPVWFKPVPEKRRRRRT
jgi:hypothetical protein